MVIKPVSSQIKTQCSSQLISLQYPPLTILAQGALSFGSLEGQFVKDNLVLLSSQLQPTCMSHGGPHNLCLNRPIQILSLSALKDKTSFNVSYITDVNYVLLPSKSIKPNVLQILLETAWFKRQDFEQCSSLAYIYEVS